MILPDLVLFSRQNRIWSESGSDTLELCKNKRHFKAYPYQVEYRYNSRGFRDVEWPDNIDEFKNAIWCLGDSFTVGIGSPVEHTWPYVLQEHTRTRTINVSMDGASNNWISRKALQIIKDVEPKHLVIHWSYISRREQSIDQIKENCWQQFYQNIADPSWPSCSWKDQYKLPLFIKDEIQTLHAAGPQPQFNDENRRLQSIDSTTEQDIENTLACIDLVDSVATSTKIIHSFIPNFSPAGQEKFVQTRVKGTCIPEFIRLDWARDYHHYDIKTSRFFVEQIMQFLS
jgi:hypothetical protein